MDPKRPGSYLRQGAAFATLDALRKASRKLSRSHVHGAQLDLNTLCLQTA